MPRNAASSAMVLQCGGGDFLHRQRRLGRRGRLAEGGHLAVGRVAAGGAEQQRVLAGRGHRHELHRRAAPHHPHVGADLDGLQAAALEDAVVGPAVGLELLIQPRVVGVQRVGVLHGELAHPDQAAARAGLVAELGLQVVDQLRQLTPGADLAAGQVGHHLLVGHGQGHVAAGAVAPVDQLRVGRVPAAGLLPQIGRVNHRHSDLLAADGVHLLANNGLDLVHAAAGQRQVGVDAGAQRLDEAGAQQQLVAGQLGVGRRVTEGLEKSVG
jgi:hypothetical protein